MYPLKCLVLQELMFCYVITPRNMTEEMLVSPEYIKKIKVQVRPDGCFLFQ